MAVGRLIVDSSETERQNQALMAIECNAISIGLVYGGIWYQTEMDVPFCYMFHFFLIFFFFIHLCDAVMLYFSKYSLYDGCLLVTHRINVDIGYGILPGLSLNLVTDFSTMTKRRKRNKENGELFSKIKIFLFHICQTQTTNSTMSGKVEKKRELKAILWHR